MKIGLQGVHCGDFYDKMVKTFERTIAPVLQNKSCPAAEKREYE